MIVLDGVSKTFDDGQSYAVHEMSLQVNEGETLVLLGSSGCGKTTTLKMINRLIEPTSGMIRVDGRDVTKQLVVPACCGASLCSQLWRNGSPRFIWIWQCCTAV